MFGDPVKNEKGWEVRRLGECLPKGEKISYGIVQPGEHDENGIPVVRVGDIDGFEIKTDSLKKVSRSIEASYSKTRLLGDEVIIACVGSIGKIGLATEALKGFNLVRATARVRVNEQLLNRLFLAYYLNQSKIQSYFNSETRTVSQPTLNIQQIQETDIWLPPLAFQNSFAQQVEAIGNIRKISSNSEALFQSLLQRAFRGELVE